MGIGIGIGAIFVFCFGLLFPGFLGWFSSRRKLILVEELCPSILEAKGMLPQIRWLGHSSYRIEWGDRVLLLDPVLARRVSIAPRLCDLPGCDVLNDVSTILISHAHMDHLDNGTLEQVAPCDLYFPRNSERFFSRKLTGLHQLRPVDLGKRFNIGHLEVTPVHARHGGWRYPWQRGHFACGFVISDGETVLYYAGDTAWGGHFADIAERFHPDISILPIGGYSPSWFLKSRHLNPPEAVKAARILGSRWVIPGHFGTYRVSLEPMDEPLSWFRKELLNR